MIKASIRVEPDMPNTLGEFCPHVAALCARLEFPVVFDWNGCDVMVFPGSDPGEIEREILCGMVAGAKALVIAP